MSTEEAPHSSGCSAEDLLRLIKTRRSIRVYEEGRVIPLEHIRMILDAGRWAPSGSNIQPWVFIAIRDSEVIRKIRMLSPGIFTFPSAIIVLCIDRERSRRGGRMGDTMALMDISMAAQNMMLQAHALGIASCVVLSFSKNGVARLLDLPKHVEPVLLLTLGYAKIRPKPPRRRGLEEVAHIDRYGRRFK